MLRPQLSGTAVEQLGLSGASMSDLGSPSARRVARPRWLDLRVIAGVVLVLVSVLVGVRVFAAADDSEPVWVAAHDLAPGTQIAADDLVRGKVQLYGQDGRYVSADGPAPIGYVVTRTIGDDEIVPVGAIVAAVSAAPYRLVTVPVAPLHLPPRLVAGERVDVYVTPKVSGSDAVAPLLVHPAATVQSITEEDGGLTRGSDELAVVLQVAPGAVAELVAGIRGGDVDLVRVPKGQATR